MDGLKYPGIIYKKKNNNALPMTGYFLRTIVAFVWKTSRWTKKKHNSRLFCILYKYY